MRKYLQGIQLLKFDKFLNSNSLYRKLLEQSCLKKDNNNLKDKLNSLIKLDLGCTILEDTK